MDYEIGGGNRLDFLAEGESCWRKSRTDRLGWCIDAEAYFAALHESLARARREILIIGWDIDSRLALLRDETHPDHPGPLADTLERLSERNAELQIHVLAWDFAMIYLLERQLLPARAFGWRRHRRLHFELDGRHAVGASHHQKLVIVDGTLAFIGGIDLTRGRWDTRDHAAGDTRRTNSEGDPYPPFHDVHAVVTGDVVADLRELADWRWRNAAGEGLADLAGDVSPGDLWPPSVTVQTERADVALARTWCSPEDGSGIREVREAYLRLINRARRWIYIENQYLTSSEIGEALAARLEAEDGPEIVIVLPAATPGWLEQATMDQLRNRVIGQLRKADRHDRLRIVSPTSRELGDTGIMVHSKLMIVDGDIARVGSANLSARSMGLDTECDLIVASSEAATALSADLLAEHLGAEVGPVRRCLEEDGLVATLDRFRREARALTPFDVSVSDLEEALLLPVADLADMEKPIMRAPESGSPAILARVPRSGWLSLGAAVIAIALWYLSGSVNGTEDLEARKVLSSLRSLATHPLAPLAVLPAFLLGSLLFAPVTGMVALCALLFDPWIAIVAALGGIVVATAFNHRLGSRFHNALMRRVPDSVTSRIDAITSSSDVWTLAGLRLIPIAPFSLINLVVGAAGIGLRDFLIGTLIALAPTTIIICLSLDRARAVLAGEPVFNGWIIAALGVAGVTTILMRLRLRG